MINVYFFIICIRSKINFKNRMLPVTVHWVTYVDINLVFFKPDFTKIKGELIIHIVHRIIYP